jgi:hypothetical protein
MGRDGKTGKLTKKNIESPGELLAVLKEHFGFEFPPHTTFVCPGLVWPLPQETKTINDSDSKRGADEQPAKSCQNSVPTLTWSLPLLIGLSALLVVGAATVKRNKY